MLRTSITVLWLGVGCSNLIAEEAALTFLPKNVTSPQLTATMNGVSPSGQERNIGGWIVLNGARFRNFDYPELAAGLAENYAKQGIETRIQILRSYRRIFSKPLQTEMLSEAWLYALREHSAAAL